MTKQMMTRQILVIAAGVWIGMLGFAFTVRPLLDMGTPAPAAAQR